jgi:gamma-glutamyl:cysteine ligase YbdK (ATP-grasp superfamily)
VRKLLEIETMLSQRLAAHGLGLAICGYNPGRDGFVYDPPLNPWEQQLRRGEISYQGSHIANVTYGPDVNLSQAGWSEAQCLDAARKLNFYSPYVVPFSFSSPYAAGLAWGGRSKRTKERAGQRPAVKAYLRESSLTRGDLQSSLLYPARSEYEHGRLEFKAFDAIPSAELLSACAQLLVGICLDEQLRGRSEQTDLTLYRRAAVHAFDDAEIRQGAAEVLRCAERALLHSGGGDRALTLLTHMLESRTTPADSLLLEGPHTGKLYWAGGLTGESHVKR